jgi:hypothetical protein
LDYLTKATVMPSKDTGYSSGQIDDRQFIQQCGWCFGLPEIWSRLTFSHAPWRRLQFGILNWLLGRT